MRLSGHAVKVLSGCSSGPAAGFLPGPSHTGYRYPVRRRGVNARQSSRVAVTVLPALLRAADAHQLPVIVPRILTVKLRKVQVPAPELPCEGVRRGLFVPRCTARPAEAAGRLTVQPVPRVLDQRRSAQLHPRKITAAIRQPLHRRQTVRLLTGRQPLFAVDVPRLMLPQHLPVSRFSTVCRSPVRRPLSS